MNLMAMREELDILEIKYDSEIDIRKQRVLEVEIASLTRRMEEAQAKVPNES